MRRVYQLAALAVALIVGARSATAAAPERARSRTLRRSEAGKRGPLAMAERADDRSGTVAIKG